MGHFFTYESGENKLYLSEPNLVQKCQEIVPQSVTINTRCAEYAKQAQAATARFKVSGSNNKQILAQNIWI